MISVVLLDAFVQVGKLPQAQGRLFQCCLPPTHPVMSSQEVPQPYERGSLLQDSHRSDQGPQFTKHFSLSERGLVIFLKMERNRHKGVLVLIKNKPNRPGDQLEELGRRPASRAGPQSLNGSKINSLRKRNFRHYLFDIRDVLSVSVGVSPHPSPPARFL